MTLQERHEANRFGYKFLAHFKSGKGIGFRKFFMNKEEMNDFIIRSEEVGTTVIKIEEV